MSNWLPAKGELFYTRCTKVHESPVINLEGDVVSVLKTRDQSYSNDILRMMGSDDTIMVAEVAYGGYHYGKPIILRRDEWIAIPVGPAVIAALSLQSTNKE